VVSRVLPHRFCEMIGIKWADTNILVTSRRSRSETGARVDNPALPTGRRVSQQKKITVLVVDDNAIMRRCLRDLLDLEGHCRVIGQAGDGRRAVKMARTLRPDVILMDIAMPVLNGLEATRQILASNPAAKVLILSALIEDEYIERMSAVGAKGFLEKQSVTAVTKAVREVAKGNLFLSPAIAKRMANRKNRSRDRDGPPTPGGVRLRLREVKVLKLAIQAKAVPA
jgi:DNA-binding NarL/FixJ family response regulator